MSLLKFLSCRYTSDAGRWSVSITAPFGIDMEGINVFSKYASLSDTHCEAFIDVFSAVQFLASMVVRRLFAPNSNEVRFGLL